MSHDVRMLEGCHCLLNCSGWSPFTACHHSWGIPAHQYTLGLSQCHMESCLAHLNSSVRLLYYLVLISQARKLCPYFVQLTAATTDAALTPDRVGLPFTRRVRLSGLEMVQPHLSSTFHLISKEWMQSVDAKPGLNTVMLDMLQRRREEVKYGSVTLMLDAMAIKKYVQYNPCTQKMSGYVDMGNGMDETDVATEVLVFMVVGIQGHWKAPVAYYLTKSLSPDTQKVLVVHALEELHARGIRVVCMTMDGHASNVNMCNQLGCQEIREISWSYIVELNNVQTKDALHAANKITNKHVNFDGQKVSLAAQTLSHSVVVALRTLRDLGYSQFKNCEATAEFIEMIDGLFDILNSRNPRTKGSKAPLGAINWTERVELLLRGREYLLSLVMKDGTPLHQTKRYLSVIGFVINIDTLLMMIPDLLQVQRYVCTYRFSQDHLELLFNSIRASGGWNNNPTAGQFQGIFRRLMVSHQVSQATWQHKMKLCPYQLQTCTVL
ncbi:hypothetical protein QQF64_020009 [Cirrhinus molitorella]|uniref:THAP domain containing 9 n=1 Tax=Cirrhinus molitorella TaxID=172907 RepID=A0ABR3LL68_9TELE